MGYMLRDGLTYCELDDRLIFLDVAADRYFCLQPDVEVRFRCVAAGTGDKGALDALARTGLVSRTLEDEWPRPCPPGPRPSRSLLDCRSRPGSSLVVIQALARLSRTRRALRRGGLSRLLDELRRAQLRLPGEEHGGPHPAALERLAFDFERTARLTRSHDQCLPRAITLAGMGLARGLALELVIGVQLRPFAAHAWVRSGATLVNERVDTAVSYTPILVL